MLFIETPQWHYVDHECIRVSILLSPQHAVSLAFSLLSLQTTWSYKLLYWVFRFNSMLQVLQFISIKWPPPLIPCCSRTMTSGTLCRPAWHNSRDPLLLPECWDERCVPPPKCNPIFNDLSKTFKVKNWIWQHLLIMDMAEGKQDLPIGFSKWRSEPASDQEGSLDGQSLCKGHLSNN